MMNYTQIVPTSCATSSNCQDTTTSPDLSWLVIPGLVLATVVIATLIYFAIKGGKGL